MGYVLCSLRFLAFLLLTTYLDAIPIKKDMFISQKKRASSEILSIGNSILKKDRASHFNCVPLFETNTDILGHIHFVCLQQK